MSSNQFPQGGQVLLQDDHSSGALPLQFTDWANFDLDDWLNYEPGTSGVHMQGNATEQSARVDERPVGPTDDFNFDDLLNFDANVPGPCSKGAGDEGAAQTHQSTFDDWHKFDPDVPGPCLQGVGNEGAAHIHQSTPDARLSSLIAGIPLPPQDCQAGEFYPPEELTSFRSDTAAIPEAYRETSNHMDIDMSFDNENYQEQYNQMHSTDWTFFEGIFDDPNAAMPAAVSSANQDFNMQIGNTYENNPQQLNHIQPTGWTLCEGMLDYPYAAMTAEIGSGSQYLSTQAGQANGLQSQLPAYSFPNHQLSQASVANSNIHQPHSLASLQSHLLSAPSTYLCAAATSGSQLYAAPDDGAEDLALSSSGSWILDERQSSGDETPTEEVRRKIQSKAATVRERPKYDPERPWRKVNRCKGLSIRPGTINNWDSKQVGGYVDRDHPFGPWASAHYTFQYNADGELAKSTYTADELKEFLFGHPQERGRRLVIWIQKTPDGFSRRYNSADSSKCRFEGCLNRLEDYERSLKVGHWRVCFDEYWHTYGTKHDPAVAAGYVHLYCLERFLDFPNVCAKLDVRADNRSFPCEMDQRWKPALVSQACGPGAYPVARNFIRACKQGKYATIDVPAYFAYRDYERHPRESHQGTLGYAMSRQRLQDMPPSAIRRYEKRAQEQGKSNSHWQVNMGDLAMHVEGREETRVAKLKNKIECLREVNRLEKELERARQNVGDRKKKNARKEPRRRITAKAANSDKGKCTDLKDPADSNVIGTPQARSKAQKTGASIGSGRQSSRLCLKRKPRLSYTDDDSTDDEPTDDESNGDDALVLSRAKKRRASRIEDSEEDDEEESDFVALPRKKTRRF